MDQVNKERDFNLSGNNSPQNSSHLITKSSHPDKSPMFKSTFSPPNQKIILNEITIKPE
jgi:hypothetical protein